MLDGFLVTVEGPNGWKLDAFVPNTEETSPTGARTHIENLFGRLNYETVKDLTTTRAKPIGQTTRETTGGSRQEGSYSR